MAWVFINNKTMRCVVLAHLIVFCIELLFNLLHRLFELGKEQH